MTAPAAHWSGMSRAALWYGAWLTGACPTDDALDELVGVYGLKHAPILAHMAQLRTQLRMHEPEDAVVPWEPVVQVVLSAPGLPRSIPADHPANGLINECGSGIIFHSAVAAHRYVMVPEREDGGDRWELFPLERPPVGGPPLALGEADWGLSEAVRNASGLIADDVAMGAVIRSPGADRVRVTVGSLTDAHEAIAVPGMINGRCQRLIARVDHIAAIIAQARGMDAAAQQQKISPWDMRLLPLSQAIADARRSSVYHGVLQLQNEAAGTL